MVGTNATVRLAGLGSVYAGGGLLVQGTLDLTGSCDEAIKGNVHIASTAMLFLPSSLTLASPQQFRICSEGTVTCENTVNVKLNGTTYEHVKIEAVPSMPSTAPST